MQDFETTFGPSSARTPEERPGVTNQADSRSNLKSTTSQGNPVLKHVRNIRWLFGDIVPDYQLGATACALYISMRYHMLHPDYLFFRIRQLQKSFRDDVVKPLHDITKTAMLNDCTLLCAWSVEECARYLETLKSFEHKSSEQLQERVDNDYLSRLTNALTSIHYVNKTDVLTLGTQFGSLAQIMSGSMEDFSNCPGVGERKVKQLYDTFHEPFRRVPKQRRPPSPEAEPPTGEEPPPEDEETASKVEAGPIQRKSRKAKKLTPYSE